MSGRESRHQLSGFFQSVGAPLVPYRFISSLGLTLKQRLLRIGPIIQGVVARLQFVVGGIFVVSPPAGHQDRALDGEVGERSEIVIAGWAIFLGGSPKFALNRLVLKAYLLKESLDRLWTYRYEDAMMRSAQLDGSVAMATAETVHAMSHADSARNCRDQPAAAGIPVRPPGGWGHSQARPW